MKNIEKIVHKYLDLRWGDTKLVTQGKYDGSAYYMLGEFNLFIHDDSDYIFFDGGVFKEMEDLFNMDSSKLKPYIESWITNKFGLKVSRIF